MFDILTLLFGGNARKVRSDDGNVWHEVEIGSWSHQQRRKPESRVALTRPEPRVVVMPTRPRSR